MLKPQQLKDLGVSLPQSWSGLFKALMSSKYQDLKADIWYQESTDSGYGHQPAWNDVLKAMTVWEPYISADTQQLCFKPRLLHLPAGIQKHFLQFLIRHSSRIPDSEIRSFVGKIGQFVQEESSVGTQLKLVQNCVKTFTGVDDIFKRLENVPERLDDAREREVSRHQSQPENVTQDNKLTDKDDAVIVIEDDEAIEPKAKRQKLEHYGLERDGTNSIDLESKMDVDYPKDKAVVEITDMELSNVRTTPDAYSILENGLNQVIYAVESKLKLSQDKEQAVEKLKEIWHNKVETCPNEVLQAFVSLSYSEMMVAMEALELKEMSETSVSVACSHIVSVSDFISYSNCVSFLSFALYDKVMTLTQNASRVLSSAVILVADKYPKQTIDSVLVPCFSSKFGAPQVDLVSEVLKKCLNEGNQLYFLTKIVESECEMNDSKITLIQSLIESVNIDNEVISKLLGLFETQTPNLAKNLKFGKFLLAVVNKHGRMMSQETLTKFANIVDKHQSFLKKSIENVIRKIKL